jgi:signal transduction histidine kinase
LTKRLLFSYLGLALVILLILEVPLAVLAQRFERQLATDQIEKEANALAAVASDDLTTSRRAQLQALLESYQSRTGGEVTVLAPDGTLLATSRNDTDHDIQQWRPLIERALAGQTSSIYTTDEGRPYVVATVPVVEEGRPVAAVVLAAPATFTQHRIHQIWLALGIFAAGAVIVAAALSVVLARSMTLSLDRLESTVGSFGKGELSSRASETQGPVEVRSLARQFNHMAGQLHDLIEAQQRFVADASHQLRSPLTALRLRLENLESMADGASEDAIAAAGREVQRLSRIVDGLLTLGQADADGGRPVEVDVGEVIEERCDAWSALAAEKGITLESANESRSEIMRRLQPGDLDQIVDNFLANAVEVSPEQSRICVVLRPVGHGIAEVHVIDEGPGLPAEDRRRAFDRFWQGADRPSGHSGLGLAIVHQLARRNDLEVELRSAGTGGLDAVVVLPPANTR